MSELDLMNKVSLLPPNLKDQVANFVDFLTEKHLHDHTPKQPLKFGMMKGTVTTPEDFEDDLADAKLVEERKSEESIPFYEFLKQLKEEGKLDESDL